MEIEQALAQAEKYIILNQKAEARTILGEILRQFPDHEEAWLLSAQVTEKSEQILYCLQRALKVNPSSVKAGEMIGRIQNSMPLRPAILQTDAVLESEPITSPIRILPPEPAALAIEVNAVQTPPETLAGGKKNSGLAGASTEIVSQNSAPDWMLTLLKDAEKAFSVNDMLTFIQKTDQIIMVGESVIPSLVWYRRSMGPNTKHGRVADIVLRQIYGVPEDEEIEKYKKVPRSAITGLFWGGAIGFVLGLIGGDIGAAFGMMVMFAVLVWMVIWAGSTTLSNGAIRYFPQILFPIVAIWKAVEHESILGKIQDNLKVYNEKLAKMEKQEFTVIEAVTNVQPNAIGPAAAQSLSNASSGRFVYPMTVTESESGLVISRRSQPLMAYVNDGKNDCVSRLVGVDGQGLPDKKRPLYQMMLESKSKIKRKEILVIRVEDSASRKVLGKIKVIDQSMEFYRMDGVQWGSYEKLPGSSGILYQDNAKKGLGVAFDRTKTGTVTEASLSRSSEYDRVFSEEDEIVFLFAFIQFSSLHFLAWKIERNWL